MSSIGVNHRYMVRNFVIPAAAWTPASLPSLVGWWDASNAASITSSGGAVSQWNDLSGNGHHFTQATGAKQPITASHTMNALNTLDFSSTGLMATAAFSQGASFTIYVVAVSASTFASPPGLTTNDNAAGGRVGQQRWNSSTVPEAIGFSGGVPKFATGSGADARNKFTIAYVYDSAGQTITNYLNGTQNGQATSTGALATALVVFAVGNSLTDGLGTTWPGDISEIVYSGAADGSSDRTSAFSYFSAKWGTP